MRLLRNTTEDATVMRDLEMLARELGPEEGRTSLAVLDAPEVPDDVPAEEAAPAEPLTPEEALLEDGFVRGFVRVTTHVRSFIAYYLGAALWLGVMLLMSPIGNSAATTEQIADPFAAGGAELASGETVESAVPEPVAAPFADIGATPSDTGGFAFAAPSDTSSEASSFESDAFSTPPSIAEEIADDPEPLRIVKSGYSSRTGGTPLEQAPPGGGLPVSAVAGEGAKHSFIGLSGDETKLRLKLVEDSSNVGAESASVRACEITAAGWTAAQGMTFDAEPAWSPDKCVAGVRGEDGIFTFDLSSFREPGSAPGFALVPGDAAGTSFNITFDKTAVTSG